MAAPSPSTMPARSSGERLAGRGWLVRLRPRASVCKASQALSEPERQRSFRTAGDCKSTSPPRTRRHASPIATAEDEHAVEYVKFGPRRSCSMRDPCRGRVVHAHQHGVWLDTVRAGRHTTSCSHRRWSSAPPMPVPRKTPARCRSIVARSICEVPSAWSAATSANWLNRSSIRNRVPGTIFHPAKSADAASGAEHPARELLEPVDAERPERAVCNSVCGSVAQRRDDSDASDRDSPHALMCARGEATVRSRAAISSSMNVATSPSVANSRRASGALM